MTYTHGHHESVLRSHKWRTVDNSAAYLAPHLTYGISVLDLGCGPGTITADIGRDSEFLNNPFSKKPTSGNSGMSQAKSSILFISALIGLRSLHPRNARYDTS